MKSKSNFNCFKTVFSREIGFALFVKFMLLAVLWWFFFAGKKQAVNGDLVADKLMGSAFSVISSPHHQEKH
jgi:hypothetical protein